jgi:hypothetical protein
MGRLTGRALVVGPPEQSQCRPALTALPGPSPHLVYADASPPRVNRSHSRNHSRSHSHNHSHNRNRNHSHNYSHSRNHSHSRLRVLPLVPSVRCGSSALLLKKAGRQPLQRHPQQYHPHKPGQRGERARPHPPLGASPRAGGGAALWMRPTPCCASVRQSAQPCRQPPGRRQQPLHPHLHRHPHRLPAQLTTVRGLPRGLGLGRRHRAAEVRRERGPTSPP